MRIFKISTSALALVCLTGAFCWQAGPVQARDEILSPEKVCRMALEARDPALPTPETPASSPKQPGIAVAPEAGIFSIDSGATRTDGGKLLYEMRAVTCDKIVGHPNLQSALRDRYASPTWQQMFTPEKGRSDFADGTMVVAKSGKSAKVIGGYANEALYYTDPSGANHFVGYGAGMEMRSVEVDAEGNRKEGNWQTGASSGFGQSVQQADGNFRPTNSCEVEDITGEKEQKIVQPPIISKPAAVPTKLAGCSGGIRGWSAGGKTCQGSVPDAGNGQGLTVTALDAAGRAAGTALFTCRNGTFDISRAICGGVQAGPIQTAGGNGTGAQPIDPIEVFTDAEILAEVKNYMRQNPRSTYDQMRRIAQESYGISPVQFDRAVASIRSAIPGGSTTQLATGVIPTTTAVLPSGKGAADPRVNIGSTTPVEPTIKHELTKLMPNLDLTDDMGRPRAIDREKDPHTYEVMIRYSLDPTIARLALDMKETSWANTDFSRQDPHRPFSDEIIRQLTGNKAALGAKTVEEQIALLKETAAGSGGLERLLDIRTQDDNVRETSTSHITEIPASAFGYKTLDEYKNLVYRQSQAARDGWSDACPAGTERTIFFDQTAKCLTEGGRQEIIAENPKLISAVEGKIRTADGVFVPAEEWMKTQPNNGGLGTTTPTTPTADLPSGKGTNDPRLGGPQIFDEGGVVFKEVAPGASSPTVGPSAAGQPKYSDKQVTENIIEYLNANPGTTEGEIRRKAMDEFGVTDEQLDRVKAAAEKANNVAPLPPVEQYSDQTIENNIIEYAKANPGVTEAEIRKKAMDEFGVTDQQLDRVKKNWANQKQ